MTPAVVTRPLTDPAAAWDEIVAHPELVWGHFAPDLEPGREYQVVGFTGSGAQGRIESVRDRGTTFTFARPGWPAASRVELVVSDALQITVRDVPAAAAEELGAHWEQVADGVAAYLNSRNPASDAPVEAVLFDADGVLQMPGAGWLDEFTRLGGPRFVVDAFAAEVECLAGGGDLRPRLQRLLDEAGTGGTVDEVLAAWHTIDVDDAVLALVGRLRAAGVTVGLATNQQSYRGAHMRDVLGLDEHFDRSFYSYEVGHAKPSAGYFEHIVADLTVPADRIAFVDDAPPNVVGARQVGLRAALHRTTAGSAGLATALAGLGVSVPRSLGSTR